MCRPIATASEKCKVLVGIGFDSGAEGFAAMLDAGNERWTAELQLPRGIEVRVLINSV